MTLLQLLVFLHLQLIFSHFDGVFSLFMGNEQVFGAYFDNFLPLSPRKSGAHTFLQKSHRYYDANPPYIGLREDDRKGAGTIFQIN